MCPMTFYNVQSYEIRHRLHGLTRIIYFRHDFKLRFGEVPGKVVPYVLHRIVLYGRVFYRGIKVVQYGVERDSPVLNGFKA